MKGVGRGVKGRGFAACKTHVDSRASRRTPQWSRSSTRAQLALAVEALEDDARCSTRGRARRTRRSRASRRSRTRRDLEERLELVDRPPCRCSPVSSRRSSIDLSERLWTILRAASSPQPRRLLVGDEQLDRRVGPDLVELVDDDADGRELVGGDAVHGQDRREDLARVDLDADVVGGDADRRTKNVVIAASSSTSARDRRPRR